MDKKQLEQSTKAPETAESKPHKFVQFVLVLAMVPLAVGFVYGLYTEAARLPNAHSSAFKWGAIAYLLIHLFVFEPLEFYKKTQQFMQYFLGFLSPVFKVSYYIIPFWGTAIMITYAVCKYGMGMALDMPTFYFLTAFSFLMHVVMVARILRTDELRAIIDYLFVILIVIIINIFFLSLNLKMYQRDFNIRKVATAGYDGMVTTIDYASKKTQEVLDKRK